MTGKAPGACDFASNRDGCIMHRVAGRLVYLHDYSTMARAKYANDIYSRVVTDGVKYQLLGIN